MVPTHQYGSQRKEFWIFYCSKEKEHDELLDNSQTWHWNLESLKTTNNWGSSNLRDEVWMTKSIMQQSSIHFFILSIIFERKAV